ncbi:hypothetical protein GCK72_022511 [Caenorhabditis remanei]|uniref:Helicase ATP-binding domain-containing protein n=1 Tax=Caenorhabditis remanei TaxID=31234 RepID=A0A6A5FTW7_CAERE|nr:hypothetical protein GCK72_022511 [Caenorhabditis remanei]KAF1746060.1 hypothetical protein GCK72_022511 [Caenorhabditis remanei]
MDLSHVDFFVLDEADKLMDDVFRNDIKRRAAHRNQTIRRHKMFANVGKVDTCAEINSILKQNGVENHFRDNHLPVSGKGKDDKKMNRMWDEGTYFTKSEKPKPNEEPKKEPKTDQTPSVKKIKKFDPTKPSTSKVRSP